MPVQYNVSTLLQEAVGSTREYDIDDRVLVDDESPRHEHIVGRATFLRTNAGVLVTALLRGSQHEECSRCLADVAVPVAIEIEEEFCATVDAKTGTALEEPEDAEAFRISSQHILDLEEAIRQSWSGALPMQPLCRADCRGLCIRCGKDLNEGACGCGEELDERWSALQQLVKKQERT